MTKVTLRTQWGTFSRTKSHLCTRLCLLWATLIFYSHEDNACSTYVERKKAEVKILCPYDQLIFSKGAKGNSVGGEIDFATKTSVPGVGIIKYPNEGGVHACWVTQSCPTLCDSMEPARLLCPWDFPGKNTAVGCHAFLPGDLSDPGIQPTSPALAGRFFTTSAT